MLVLNLQWIYKHVCYPIRVPVLRSELANLGEGGRNWGANNQES